MSPWRRAPVRKPRGGGKGVEFRRTPVRAEVERIRLVRRAKPFDGSQQMHWDRSIHPSPHPDLVKYAEERARSLQNRVADWITRFAGSMWFVYLHVAAFGYWLATAGSPFVSDPFPFGLLTMVVSLEAIFLSTFVMISQNRADDRRQVIADHQWELTQVEWKENNEILGLSRQMLELTERVHALTREVHASVTAKDREQFDAAKGE